MDFKKKIAAAGIALTMIMGVQSYVHSSITFAAAAPAVREFATFTEDIRSIRQQKRHDYLYVFQVKNAMMQMTGEGTVSCKADPDFLLMGNMKTRTVGIDKKEKVAMAPFYLKETPEGLVFYTREADGQWTKETSKNPTDISLLKGNFEQNLCNALLESQKEVTLLKKEKDSRVYKVTVDGSRLLKNMPMFQAGQKLAGADNSMANAVLDNIGDVDVFLGIDSKHHNISVFKTDLSKPVQNAFRTAAAKNGLAGMQAAALNAMTSHMNVVVELTVVSPKVIGDIAIPAEVEAKAAERTGK